MMFENSGNTTGRFIRLNANPSYGSGGNDSEASLEFGKWISSFQDMEAESILPKTNISADISSSSCTRINVGNYIENRFQWLEVSRTSSRNSWQHKRNFLQCAAQIWEELEMARKTGHRVVQAKWNPMQNQCPSACVRSTAIFISNCLNLTIFKCIYMHAMYKLLFKVMS